MRIQPYPTSMFIPAPLFAFLSQYNFYPVNFHRQAHKSNDCRLNRLIQILQIKNHLNLPGIPKTITVQRHINFRLYKKTHRNKTFLLKTNRIDERNYK